jgi:hypothetical protein
MASLFLVHGGLWNSMDQEHFWRTPGIVTGLESHGLTVIGVAGRSELGRCRDGSS